MTREQLDACHSSMRDKIEGNCDYHMVFNRNHNRITPAASHMALQVRSQTVGGRLSREPLHLGSFADEIRGSPANLQDSLVFE
jgi:hypothetical protein